MSTVDKALSLLNLVATQPESRGLTEIARIASLDKATTRRLLVDLQAHGFIEQDPDTKRYRLGTAPVRLARIREQRFPFLKTAIPFARELAVATSETVHLSEMSGKCLSSIHVEESSHAHRVIVDVGICLPLHATASGLAFLAFCPEAQVAEELSQPLRQFTSQTETDPSSIRALLAETAHRGYSVNQQSFESGVISTAAPIRNPAGQPIGAIAIAAPLTRVDSTRIKQLGAMAMATAGEISRAYFGTERPALRTARSA